ncbi:chorismate-binding protein [Streptomyces sp. NBC_01429]|uniref:chorismate-binding protein n=1 Tax=Streptomyces sp. NBC_01429 TaxID=2903862 RepID=UPI002E294FDC|nr:chorismate-binding protein [Streptomyces sp. NBC_01429]
MQFHPESICTEHGARLVANFRDLALAGRDSGTGPYEGRAGAVPAPADDFAYYRRLRRLNPAPYAALLRLGDLVVFSSSPGRFLKVDAARTVEAKPIKGTAPRHPDPDTDEATRRALRTDPRTRAENLMIVDLLRNDLGQICEIGTVTVPSLMAVESYSGVIGFVGYTGTADLSITIRTAVSHDGELTIGAGGAIVLDSDPEAEYEEMLLKAQTTLRALPTQTYAHGEPGGR